jgi:hypothetical protein
MMLNLKAASRMNLAVLDKHVYMTDLVYVDGPILSLFRDSKDNWMYLWCDTDNEKTERWMLFPVSRSDLIDYLHERKPLLDVVRLAKRHWVLDYTQNEGGLEEEKVKEFAKSYSRTLREVSDLALLTDYMPSDDSFFSPELAPNISTAHELNPTLYEVPIDGNWFIKDLDNFSNVYSQVYAFFYCTKPQFMTDIGLRVRRFLEAPWKGGFSRVNLFDALQRMVPAIHDLKIHKMEYASPGDITIEALESVGDSVKGATLRYLQNKSDVEAYVKNLNTILSAKELKRSDLSKIGDEKLPLTKEDREFIKEKMGSIAEGLAIEAEFTDLSIRSPNIVVSAKVLLAVVARIGRLAEFESAGLLDLTREKVVAEEEVEVFDIEIDLSGPES